MHNKYRGEKNPFINFVLPAEIKTTEYKMQISG